MELFAIVKDDKTLWAAVTTPEAAEEKAVTLSAGGHGMVYLLSGADLARHLMKGAGVLWREM
jgi:hypothetical protein